MQRSSSSPATPPTCSISVLAACGAIAVGFLIGCDDGTGTMPADPPPDATIDGAPDIPPSMDVGPDPDAGPDAVLDPDGAPPDTGPDTAVDAAPEPDAAPREPVPTRALPIGEAEVTGAHAVIADGVLLDPGAALTWTVADPGPLADAPFLTLAVAAEIWRVEDGAFEVRWSTAQDEIEDGVMVRGDADAAPRRARVEYDGWLDPGSHGVDARPPAHALPTGAGPYTLSLVALGGGAVVRGAWLVDPDAALPEPLPAPPPPGPATVLEPAPCAEPGCDDGALISAAIAAAPEGPITVRLAAEAYTLRTSLVVNRDHVRLEGAGDEAADATTRLVWSPTNAGRSMAIRFSGPGLQNGQAAPVVGDLAADARFVTVDAPADWTAERVWLTADDFGEVPPVCVEGRDVERFNRHLGRMVRVLSITPTDDGLRVELDRSMNLDVPAAANPRLIPARVIRGGGVFDLHVEGDCPEALDVDDFSLAPCTNAEVIDDDGVYVQWADGATVRRVSSRAFGKFAISVQRSVDVRVEHCAMDHPAAYGGGGQGYGVHLIYTGRTVVRGSRVEIARHGVVVDFGSTDAQVLDGHFRTMNQALLDVHGEASYDTLIRGNDLAGANLGIIVGGGGRDVHCNDGPRHHLEHNTIVDCDGAAITVSDYTRGVFVRSNDIDRSGILLTAAFGAGDILAERNAFGAVTLGFPPVQLFNVDTGGVVIRRNHFAADCSPDAAGGALLGAEAPVFEGNVFCAE